MNESFFHFCWNGLYITDGMILSTNVLGVFCDANWETKPSLYSNSNSINILLRAKMHTHNGIVGVVESVYGMLFAINSVIKCTGCP